MAYEARGETSSVADLLKGLVQQVGTLFRQEIALARAEMSESTSKIGRSAVSMAIAFLLSLGAFIMLLFAAAYGLAEVMPLWASTLIVGVVVAVIAAVLFFKARKDISAHSLAPTRTARTLREDLEFAKDQVR